MELDISTVLQVKRPLRALVPKESRTSITKPVTKTKLKRSKNGCLSCKKLKIKCSEDKPHCEYCLQTNRVCVYSQQELASVQLITTNNRNQMKNNGSMSRTTSNESITQSSSSESDVIEVNTISANTSKKLNSMTFQLDVSSFELKLLKFYIDFGGELFSNNVNKRSYSFWENEIPRLWCESDLIKHALYAISSTRLLTKYDTGGGKEHLKSISIDNGVEYDNMGNHYTEISLYEETGKYIQKAKDLMNSYLSFVSLEESPNLQSLVEQILICKKLLTGSQAIFPRDTEIDTDDLKKLSVYEVLDTTAFFLKIIQPYIQFLGDHKYSLLFDVEESNVEDCHYEFRYIKHLRNCLDKRCDVLDPSQITYLDAIDTLERGCKRAMVYNFPIALFKVIIELTMDEDFVVLFKAHDHLALKIIFYCCCLNVIFNHDLHQKSGLSEQFIQYYKRYSYRTFYGGFEDDMDTNFYESADFYSNGRAPYNMTFLKQLGQPIDKILSDGFEMMDLNDDDM